MPSNIKILYVEDDTMNQMVVRGLLKSLGYENMTLANNAKEALDILKNEKFDIILMDLGLPGDMNGIELTKTIRRSQFPSKDIPIIALTGNTEDQAQKDSLAAGMNDFLKKPVEKEALEAVFNQFFS